MSVAAILAAAALASATPGAAKAAATPPRPNIVLMTLDTTRADHLGCYGWPYARTPNLDALAARGVRFARCETAAPITLPSHATIMTGLLPPRHGVRDNGTFSLSKSVPTLATVLAGNGYDTAGVVAAIILAQHFGLNNGCRIYDDDLGEGYGAGTIVEERDAEHATDAALKALASLRSPFFLWVHYFDPHAEYRPPSRFADSMKGPHRLYDGEIAFVDEQVGRLLATLPANTVVLAVGDHGEMLGEHGELYHGLLLYHGARHVPMILAGPGIPGGRVVSELVRTVDIMPTLLAEAAVTPPPGLDGESVLPLVEGKVQAPRTSYCESFLPFFTYRWYPLRSLSDTRWFYLLAPKPSLYDLREDPAEAKDVAVSFGEVADRWRRRLERMLTTIGESASARYEAQEPLSDELRRQLRSLGYLGGAATGSVTQDLPDPRTMTEVDAELQAAASQVQHGRCDRALEKLSAIARRDPNNFVALCFGGTCLLQQGETERALDWYRKAAAINPDSPVPLADIGGCLLKLGRKAEAEDAYRRALKLDLTVQGAAANLARLLHERGAPKEARAVLDASIEAGAHSAENYAERGVISAKQGRVDAAYADFREAARRDPANPVPLENAARAAYQLGRFRESALYYEQLLRAAPSRADIWKTMGAVYMYKLNAPADALRCFRRAIALEVDPGERSNLADLIHELGG